MKEYKAPVLSSAGRGPEWVAPVAPALVAAAAKSFTATVFAVLAVSPVASGVKKVMGDIVATDIPALEPCLD